MLFKKKQKQPTEQPLDTWSKSIDERIHVMPEKFYAPVKKDRPWFLIGAIAFAAISISTLIGVAVYLNFTISKNRNAVPVDNNSATINQNRENINANANNNTNQQATTTNQNTNQLIDATETPTTTDPLVNVNENSNVNTNANSNTNTNEGEVITGPDRDGDQLSDAEEILFGTNQNNSDTDGDGFSDGSEIINGYDPNQANRGLSSSGLFRTYTHGSYSIMYPTGWQVQELGDDKSEVFFRSQNGDFIEIVILSNAARSSIRQWYNDQIGNPNVATAVQLNGLIGFRHPDNQNYYLVSLNEVDPIYLITYNNANKAQADFLLTFNVMVRSFKLK